MGNDDADPNMQEVPTSPAPGVVHPGSDSWSTGRLPQRLGRYTLLRRLGVGGMAEVFLAQQDGPAGFCKTCVVKRILPHLAEEPRFVEMFQREARLAALLQHTNVVQIYELGEVDGSYFIAMEHVDGLPLHRLARAAWRTNEPLPMEVVCCAIADAALGLAAAHEQHDERGQPLHLVHRDISPDNLIINREGITKILDFGVAKSTQGERTATGEIKGKVPFLSPEQIRGDAVDGRSDLYSLGVTAYWLLTGKRPFTAPSDLGIMQAVLAELPRPTRALNPTVPDALDELVTCLLDKDPAQRPQSGHEIADVLAPVLALRRTMVSPFVREVMGREAASQAIEESGPAKPGFLPSTPSSEEVKSSLRHLAPARSARPAPQNLTLANETAPTAPSLAGEQSGLTNATAPLEVGSRRGPLVAAALGGAVLIAAALAFVITRSDAAQPTPTAAAPPPAAAKPTPAQAAPIEAAPIEAAPIEAAPIEAAPIEATAAAAAADETTPPRRANVKAARAPKERPVAAAAPRWVQWQTKAGKRLGSGTTVLNVPANISQVVAIDTRRGGRALLDVSDGAADYSRLPHGKLQVRATPNADVFLGDEALGGTPLPPIDLVVGSYTVTLRKGGAEKRERVEVKAGQLARVSVSFER